MNKQVLENSSFDIDIGLNDKRVTIILDKLLVFKNYTSKTQVSSMILFTLIKNINYIMLLNDNRYLLWAYIYCSLQRIYDKTPVFSIERKVNGKKIIEKVSMEKNICSMLIRQISDLLEINDVFHKGVQSFYNLISKDEKDDEFNFLLSVLDNIEANNIYVQHIDELLADYKLGEFEKVNDRGTPKEEMKSEKDYIKVLKPLLINMFVNFGDFDESKMTYRKYLSSKLNETKVFIDELSKKGNTNTKKPQEKGLRL